MTIQANHHENLNFPSMEFHRQKEFESKWKNRQ